MLVLTARRLPVYCIDMAAALLLVLILLCYAINPSSSLSFAKARATSTSRSRLLSSVADEIIDVNPVDLDLKRAQLKTQLLQRVSRLDRGYGSTEADRQSVDSIVQKLRQVNPSKDSATDNLFPNASDGECKIEGVWSMAYTTAFDVLTLNANPLTIVQQIRQVISRDGRSVNVIDLVPRVQSLLPYSVVGKGSTIRLKVFTSAFARGASRVGLTFKRLESQLLSLFSVDINLRLLGIDFPQVASGFGGGADGPGFFDVWYLDEDLLIISQNQPGGFFVNVRSSEEDTAAFL